MSFDEKIAALSQKLPKLIDNLSTEEATKNALIMPFISALGYDVFNPEEVIPEFTCDVGTKKGEKIDYAIKHNGKIEVLIECKSANADLKKVKITQLFRYFSVVDAQIAILTNGIHYWFFSHLEKENLMDDRPYLKFDLQDIRQDDLSKIKLLTKKDFDLNEMLHTAFELRHVLGIKEILAQQYEAPEDDFIRFFFARMFPGNKLTKVQKEWFAPRVIKGFQHFINEKVNNRLKTALQSEDINLDQENNPPSTESQDKGNGIVTTEEELEGYRIIRAIACKCMSSDRICHRDTKSYMGILLDDNNRKPICRLWFNSGQKYIGIFDQDKNETKIPIEELSDIYQYADKLIETIKYYEEN